jgi:hypothetical protein
MIIEESLILIAPSSSAVPVLYVRSRGLASIIFCSRSFALSRAVTSSG